MTLSWAEYAEQDSRTNLSEEGGNDTIPRCITRLHGQKRQDMMEQMESDQGAQRPDGNLYVLCLLCPNIRTFGRVDHLQIHDNIFVDSSPTQIRSPRRIWKLRPNLYDSVQVRIVRSTTCWKPKDVSVRLGQVSDNLDYWFESYGSRHHDAQRVRETTYNLRFRPKPWPDDGELDMGCWNAFKYIYI